MSIVVNKTRLPVTEWQTESGSVVSVNNARRRDAKSAVVTLQPIQDLHGYANPWVGGNGRNKFNPNEAQNNKWVNNTTGAIDNRNGYWVTGFIPVKAGDVVRCPSKSSGRNAWYNTDKSQATYVTYNGGSGGITAPADGFIVITAKDTTISFGSDFIVTINDADLTYEPYENICPISGFTGVNIYHESAYDPDADPTYSIDWPDKAGTVYGGSLDVTTGVLTVDRIMFERNSSTMNNSENYPGWKNAGVRANNPKDGQHKNDIVNVGKAYAINVNGSNDIIYLPEHLYNHMNQTDWIALAIDVQIVYELATPVTFQLTPTQIEMLMRNNTIWSDDGIVTVNYARIHS